MSNELKYTKNEVIEISKQNPTTVYELDDKKLAYNGTVFKNEEELKLFIKLVNKPPKFIRFIIKIFIFLFVKKKMGKN